MSDETHLPWLLADVGGTNVRFGLVETAGGRPGRIAVFKCAEFSSLEAAANAYLAHFGTAAAPGRAAMAIATAIDGDTVTMTNSPWTISRRAVQRALGVERLLLLNDFEALALALPRLGAEEIRVFGGPAIRPQWPMAAIGPGTGLGVAGCVPTPDGWIALATEGGHVTLAAADEFEADVLRAARREHEHVSAERLLSGIGLPLLHRAIAQVRGEAAATLAPEEITHRALHEGDALCRQTVETFCAMLGTFAGNVALTLGARGGVFIAGGIAQQLGEVFIGSRFRARFEAKGRFRDYLAAIGTALVTAPHAALLGAAQAIDNDLRG